MKEIINFNIDFMASLLRDCAEMKSDMDICYESFDSINGRMQEEFASFNSEAQNTLRQMERYSERIIHFINQIEHKIDYYKKHLEWIKDKGGSQKEESACIDKINMCQKIKSQIEPLSREIIPLQHVVNNKVKGVSNFYKENMSKNQKISQENKYTKSAMEEHLNLFYQMYDFARNIYEFEATSLNSANYSNRFLDVKNTHDHQFNNSASNISFSRSANVVTENNSFEKEDNMVKDEEILIKDRDKNTFFENILNLNKVKMPSSSLHKLGGKDFILKMNEIGYEIVKGEDGATIDSKGMIHWEKKDV